MTTLLPSLPRSRLVAVTPSLTTLLWSLPPHSSSSPSCLEHAVAYMQGGGPSPTGSSFFHSYGFDAVSSAHTSDRGRLPGRREKSKGRERQVIGETGRRVLGSAHIPSTEAKASAFPSLTLLFHPRAACKHLKLHP